MKLKTLLLGSAAAFAVVGGAQAADLSIAEPVDYVRVCDAFGVGYWYIPGTDTCIKIGGKVEFIVNFHSLSNLISGSTHSSTWNFVTEIGLNFTAKSMTEYGELIGYVALQSKYDNNATGTNNSTPVTLDGAWLSLGPVLFGHTGSIQNIDGGYSDNAWRPDNSVDQIRLSWAMSGFGIMLGIEDPRDRWGTSLSTTYTMPDIVAAITASQATWDGKLTAGWAQIGTGGVYGVAGSLTFKLDAIAPGDALRIAGAFGTGVPFLGMPGGIGVNGNTMWTAFASFQHYFSPTVSAALTGTYAADSTAGTSAWGIGANLVWAPVTGFSTKLQGTYVVNPSTATGVWAAKVAVKREW